jgi:hypothetical protein
MRGNERSMIRAVRGPITLITVGVLLALNNFTEYRFDQTWPVILIVFGLMTLVGRGTDRIVPPAPGYPPGPGYPPPPGYTQAWMPQQGPGSPGSYSQSPYSQPAGGQTPPGPAKGGFGSSAAPNRTPEPNQAPQSDPGGSV